MVTIARSLTKAQNDRSCDHSFMMRGPTGLGAELPFLGWRPNWKLGNAYQDGVSSSFHTTGTLGFVRDIGITKGA